jgi:hypothetical protein
MGTTYQTADEDVLAVLRRAVDEFHPALRAANVEVGVIVASNCDGPAVKHAGYPCLANIRVVPLKDRVTKEYDAELLIDETEWNSISPAQRLACLDHELTHLEVVTDKESGVVVTDDLGRPKLRTRKGDWNGGDGFAEVVERHGDSAIEFYNALKAYGRAKAAAARKPSLTDGAGEGSAGGIDTITIEVPGEKAVTITPGQLEELADKAGKQARGRKREPA